MKNFDSIKDDVMVGIENRLRYAYDCGYSHGHDDVESINFARSIGRQEGWECAKRVLFDSSLPKEILSKFPKADTWAGLVKYYSVEDVLSALRELDSTSDSKHCHTCAFYKRVCDCVHCGGQHLDWAPITIENDEAAKENELKLGDIVIYDSQKALIIKANESINDTEYRYKALVFPELCTVGFDDREAVIKTGRSIPEGEILTLLKAVESN